MDQRDDLLKVVYFHLKKKKVWFQSYQLIRLNLREPGQIIKQKEVCTKRTNLKNSCFLSLKGFHPNCDILEASRDCIIIIINVGG